MHLNKANAEKGQGSWNGYEKTKYSFSIAISHNEITILWTLIMSFYYQGIHVSPLDTWLFFSMMTTDFFANLISQTWQVERQVGSIINCNDATRKMESTISLLCVSVWHQDFRMMSCFIIFHCRIMKLRLLW